MLHLYPRYWYKFAPGPLHVRARCAHTHQHCLSSIPSSKAGCKQSCTSNGCDTRWSAAWQGSNACAHTRWQRVRRRGGRQRGGSAAAACGFFRCRLSLGRCNCLRRSSIGPEPTSIRPTIGSAKQLMHERYLREAVTDKTVTIAEMLAELRVALMDRMRYELATFHGRDFRDEILIRRGKFFVQCPPHKYKNLVQAIKRLEPKPESEDGDDQLSKRRLLEVADSLVANAVDANDRRRFQTLQLALTGGTDMQSQAACIYLLICPEYLAALKAREDCWREHTILYIYGQAWMAWDRPHLSMHERVRVIESWEALLSFNLGGEQLYLPFLNETAQGASPGLKGILAKDMGSFCSSQNLLAFLSNAAVHRQFREQYPDEYVHTVERSWMNNDVETFHSEITQQLGIKPTMRNLLGRLSKIDYSMRMLFNPERRYHITLSRKKMYDPVEFYLAHQIFKWNDGTAIDLLSEAGQKYLKMVAERAMNSAKGKQESIRSHFNRANKIVRDSIRAIETSKGAQPKPALDRLAGTKKKKRQVPPPESTATPGGGTVGALAAPLDQTTGNDDLDESSVVPTGQKKRKAGCSQRSSAHSLSVIRVNRWLWSPSCECALETAFVGIMTV